MKKKRRMAGTKEEVVLRLLRGEDMETVSRESGFAMHELKKWFDQYKRGGRQALKSHPEIGADLEKGQNIELKDHLCKVQSSADLLGLDAKIQALFKFLMIR